MKVKVISRLNCGFAFFFFFFVSPVHITVFQHPYTRKFTVSYFLFFVIVWKQILLPAQSGVALERETCCEKTDYGSLSTSFSFHWSLPQTKLGFLQMP